LERHGEAAVATAFGGPRGEEFGLGFPGLGEGELGVTVM